MSSKYTSIHQITPFFFEIFTGNMIPNPVAGVWLYTIALFLVLIFTCFEKNKEKIITDINKKHPTLHHILYFLAGAATESTNHVKDTVIKMLYHYFHIKK